MSKKVVDQKNDKKLGNKGQPYEAPAIIYEGLITTSSKQTGIESGGTGDKNMDPADLFNG